MRTLSVLLVLLLVGCPKDEKKGEPEKTAEQPASTPEKKKKSSEEDPTEKKEKKEPKHEKKASGPHALAGVDVPEWSHPTTSKTKCTIAKDAQKKLDALKSGDDDGAGFDDGKGDVEPIVETYEKTCGAARTAVSQALNAGGYTRYSKKEYAKADGWFARALALDPSNTFARYNLACNLALEGNSDQALWNLEQLVPAAKAGDPRATHYLKKATSDDDLKSVRKDPRFGKATSNTYEQPGQACANPKAIRAKDQCMQICSSFGAQGGCPAGDACTGADHFGDGLVPYCADALNCKEGEKMLEVKDGEVYPAPGAKAKCFVQCNEDSDCSGGKKCNGLGAMPTPYGAMVFNVCK